MLTSVLIAMVLFGISLPAVIHLHMRATAMSWNARAEQQAVAVAAWHAAQARTGGCDDLDADKTLDGYNAPTVTALAGQKLLPPDGFVVDCATEPTDWPPPLTTTTTTPAATTTTAPQPATLCKPEAEVACVLTVTTNWTRLDGTSRSLPLRVLTPP